MRLRSLLLLVLSLALTPASALAARPRASLTDIEYDLMCTSCHEPLAVADSPQAISERDYLRKLIAQGLDKSQIERIMVAQYGTAVLAKPPAHGFNLTVYILPPAVIALGIITLAVVLPRWRRRNPPPGSGTEPPNLDAADRRRLEEELSRFGG